MWQEGYIVPNERVGAMNRQQIAYIPVSSSGWTIKGLLGTEGRFGSVQMTSTRSFATGVTEMCFFARSASYSRQVAAIQQNSSNCPLNFVTVTLLPYTTFM